MSDRVTLGILFGACVMVLLLGWLVLFKLAAPILTHRASSPAVAARPSNGKPIPCGPNAPLERQLQTPYASFFRKGYVTAYKEHGKHNPAWDAAAEKFLDDFALRTAGVLNAPSAKKNEAEADGLLAKHCDDPLVLEIIGKVKLDAKQLAEADRLIQKSIPGMKKRGYPPLCLAGAYEQMTELSGEAGPRPQATSFKWRTLALKAYAAASDRSAFSENQQRIMWVIYQNILRSWYPAAQDEFIKDLEARPNTDPWLLAMAKGTHLDDYAWQRRGNGFANSVSPEDWKAFTKASLDAYSAFKQAYRAHPEYPEACDSLLDTVNATGDATGDTPREWFDRGVTDCFDYMPLYGDMLNALLPRWGGTHEQMLAFGKECLDTGRFDTPVPQVYYRTVLMIARRDGDPSILRDPAVWRNLKKMFEGMMAYAEKNRPEDVPSIKRAYVGAARRTGHPNEITQQWRAGAKP